MSGHQMSMSLEAIGPRVCVHALSVLQNIEKHLNVNDPPFQKRDDPMLNKEKGML